MTNQDYEIIHIDATEPEFGIQLGEVDVRVHAKANCSGRCPIHAPTDHHMVTWPLNWRADRQFMERRCSHGVGHPDPDDRKVRSGPGMGIHGCDGCCGRPQG